KEKPSAEEAVKLARWALEHGLTEECAQVMDKLAETDSSHTAVVAYRKIKADLARAVDRENVAGKWDKALPGYKGSQNDNQRFALVHPGAVAAARPYLDRLERSFKTYYYWWALRGLTLPVPAQRQVAVLAASREDFGKLKKNLSASPVLADSF